MPSPVRSCRGVARRSWISRGVLCALLVLSVGAGDAEAQRRRTTRRAPARPAPTRPAPTPAPPQPVARVEPAVVKCPQVLGEGARTKKQYCDVLIGRDPAQGILVTIPPHVGPATVMFELHNRHTYSEDAVKEGKGFHRFTATVGLLTMDVTLLSRAVVQSEFRTATDLVERISGGSGPAGLKAVAPTGTEAVAILVAEDVTQVSILGEKLAVVRVDGSDNFDFRVQGRPAALVSDIRVEYQPAPVRPAPRAK